MKVVIDTNIYLSGLIFPNSLPRKILNLTKGGKLEVYCSPFIFREIKNILVIKFDYSEEIAEKFIDEFLKLMRLIRPTNKVNIIKKKVDDNRILECALFIKADYLVTGDKKHILPLREVEGIKIVSAREFLKNII